VLGDLDVDVAAGVWQGGQLELKEDEERERL